MYGPGLYKIVKNLCRAGIILFAVIYVVATFYYPGGSDFDRNSKGFDWLHNYWCELLASTTKSRQVNEARPIAIGAFILLDLVLIGCWCQASFLYPLWKTGRILIILPGIFSSVALWFLSSPSHDTVINIAGASGLVALTATLVGLWRKRFRFSFFLGIACIFLFFLNTYIYYTGTWFDALAVVQKISFVAFLSWFWMVAGIAQPHICKANPVFTK